VRLRLQTYTESAEIGDDVNPEIISKKEKQIKVRIEDKWHMIVNIKWCYR